MDQNILLVVFSGIVAVATVVYAILTWKLVAETRQLRKVQTEPRISVTNQPSESFIALEDLIVQNIGLGPAYNIRFTVEPDFECREGSFLSKTGFISSGLKYLAPGQKQQILLGEIRKHQDKSFKIKVSYKNAMGDIYSEEYSIEFSMYNGAFLQESPMNKLVESIKKIEADIHAISKKS